MIKQRISNVIAWAAFAYACGWLAIFLLAFVFLIVLGVDGTSEPDVEDFINLWFCYPILLLINYVLVGSYRIIPWK